MSSISGYYYLHENKDLIYKSYDPHRVSDFRDSDFVIAFWPIDISNRKSAWDILVEAGAVGANKSRIEELASKWGCDDADASHYTSEIELILKKDGDAFCAHKKDFTNLQESDAGFGNTALDAMIDLCQKLGYSPNKLNWHHSFEELVRIK